MHTYELGFDTELAIFQCKMFSSTYDAKQGVYFPYQPVLTPNMVPPSFQQGNASLQPLETAKVETYQTSSDGQQKQNENVPPGSSQQKPHSNFEDEESKKKYHEFYIYWNRIPNSNKFLIFFLRFLIEK